MSLDELQNNGIVVLNEAPVPVDSTLIIVGAPRSGTSMIAAALRVHNVPLGDSAKGAVGEDLRLAKAIEKCPNDVDAIVSEYNAKYQRWAFKRPMAFRTIEKHLPIIRNPRFIVTFRDPLAIAVREHVSMGSDILTQLSRASGITQEIISFAGRQSVPTLLVSYEKSIQNPDYFLDQLEGFCGLGYAVNLRLLASEVIKNGPDAYLKESQVRFSKSSL